MGVPLADGPPRKTVLVSQAPLDIRVAVGAGDISVGVTPGIRHRRGFDAFRDHCRRIAFPASQVVSLVSADPNVRRVEIEVQMAPALAASVRCLPHLPAIDTFVSRDHQPAMLCETSDTRKPRRPEIDNQFGVSVTMHQRDLT